MTIKRAESMTGYEIRKLADAQGLITFGAFSDGELVAKASGRVEWMALRIVVERVQAALPDGDAASWLGLCPLQVEQTVAAASPKISFAWWNPPGGQPGAGLLGLPQDYT